MEHSALWSKKGDMRTCFYSFDATDSDFEEKKILNILEISNLHERERYCPLGTSPWTPLQGCIISSSLEFLSEKDHSI